MLWIWLLKSKPTPLVLYSLYIYFKFKIFGVSVNLAERALLGPEGQQRLKSDNTGKDCEERKRNRDTLTLLAEQISTTTLQKQFVI